jgi:hypothetical protein
MKLRRVTAMGGPIGDGGPLLVTDWGIGVGWGPEVCAVEPDEGPFRLFGGPEPRLLPCE